ncbi:MAG: hypothetical protein NWF07_12830 [Candidatus Bathyarchaeota archaeon]|nr:hypothetical protein [Candidatus Bathyarchaeota archaeon]
MITLKKHPIVSIIFLLLTPTMASGLLVSPETQLEGYYYGSYLGGAGMDDIRDLILDPDGNMIVMGGTFSPDFPVQEAYQPSYAGGVQPEEPPYYGGDGFVAMFSATGELMWSTFIGGSMLEDCERGVLVGDEIIVCGATNSQDFPIVGGVGQVSYVGGQGDAFFAVYNIGGELLRSSYFGGSGGDLPEDIIVCDDGDVIIVGYTDSDDLPVTGDAFQDSLGGTADGFILKLDPQSFQINYLSYFGGSDRDSIGDIEINPVDGYFLVGNTHSSDFPGTDSLYAPVFQSSITGSERDIFLTRFSEDFELEYSTYLGGSDMEDCFGLAVDSQGSAILSGRTWSPDFPTVDAYQLEYSGVEVDGFYTKFSPEGDSLVFSSYLGYSGWDTLNRLCVAEDDGILLAGMADTSDFPVVSGFQESKRSGTDIYLLLIDQDGNHVFASYLGGDGMEHPWDCIIDDGYVYIVAQTTSSDLPSSDDAYMADYAGNTDGYIFRLSLGEYLAQAESDDIQEGDTGSSNYWTSYFVVTVFVVGIFAGWYLYSKKV